MNWIVPAYFGVGFIFLVVLFAVNGPRRMWYMLTDSDPDEPAFAFSKTTTPERARRDDDHFDACLGVFFTLFLWPAILVSVLGIGVIWLLMYCAKQIAMLFVREGGDEKE